MFEKLKEYHQNSYVPISHFPVSACVVTNDNEMFFGVNVEDASTRAGTCAERAAIFSAISAGKKKSDFKQLHVLTSSKKIGTPCFVCRQMIYEMFPKNSIITCYSLDGNSKEFTVEELCPYPFGEEDLQ